MGPKPIPRPGFLEICEYLGYIHGARRWRTPDGKHLLTWDSLHGEIEIYDMRGRHVGVKDAVTSLPIKDAVRGRKIDVRAAH